jgi:Ni/Co efflux regulator RcnB
MKKLMTLMLGMALAFGSVAVTFAQDQPKTDDTKKKKKKKKSTDDTKKSNLR